MEGSMSDLELALSVALGIGLAAATGFRVFIPFLVMSLASNAGYLPLSKGFAWLSSSPALAMLGIAALAEILAYYVPGVDNLLDALATPSAIIAGIAISAAVMTDVPPMLKWTLAIIAGGGAAGLTQAATAFTRANSMIFTGGLGNPIVATGEILGATVFSILAIAVPYLALGILLLLVLATVLTIKRIKPKKPAS